MVFFPSACSWTGALKVWELNPINYQKDHFYILLNDHETSYGLPD